MIFDGRHCQLCNEVFVMRPVLLSGELFPRYQKICPKCTGFFDFLYDEPKDWAGSYEIKIITKGTCPELVEG